MKKQTLTENNAEQTPSGGVLVGKRQGQTIIHNKGTLSGYLVGKTHAEGGIKAVNKSTGQPLEMQGGEVVITAPAVSDQTKNEFNGKMMTNREILSQINVNGGGVAFAKDGMEIPKRIKRTGASYKYGGKTMTDHEIYKYITGGLIAPNGKSSNLTPEQYKLVRTPEFKEWFGDWENDPKNSSKVVDENGEPLVVYHGTNKKFNIFKINERTPYSFFAKNKEYAETYTDDEYSVSNPKMYECFLNIRTPLDTSKNYEFNNQSFNLYYFLAKLIYKDVKEEKIILPQNYYLDNKKEELKEFIENQNTKFGSVFWFVLRKDGSNYNDYLKGYNKEYAEKNKKKKRGFLKNFLQFLNYDGVVQYENVYGEEVKGNYKKIADNEKDYASLVFAVFNSNQIKLADGTNTTFDSENDDIRYADGGETESLIKDSKRGNTPARDLNNYNDVMDLQADGMVGAETGLYADGGLIAPNGKLSNLTPEQYKLVRTPEFKEWFGDWENEPYNASKVVDENGEPLVVYHGAYSDKPFYTFDFNKADLGFHFGTYEQAKNRSETKLFFKGHKTIINSFFLNIRKIWNVTDIGEWEYPQRYLDEFILDKIIKETDAKKLGFFNLIYKKDNEKIREYILDKFKEKVGFEYNNKYDGNGKSFIVLEKNQIKLADGTNTTFNISNPDIRYKNGGETESLIKNSKRGNTPARDLNNYNDVMDLQADGMVGAETGLYADGGGLKELVEYITIGNQSSNPFNDIEKVRFYNFVDFKDFINGLYKTTGATNKRELFICINNDDSVAKVTTKISKGKNTNSNFNPSTGTFQDLEKNFKKIYPITFDSFDWSFWSGVKTSKATSSQTSKQINPDDDSVVKIELIDADYKTVLSSANNVEELLTNLIQIQADGVYNFYIKYILYDKSIFQTIISGYIKKRPSYVTDIDPYDTTNSELKEWLRKRTDLKNNKFNLDYFFSKNGNVTQSNATSIPTTKILTIEELRNKKIWIGDDLPLLNKVIDKLKSMGIPYDAVYSSKNPTNNIYIETYVSDFVVWQQDKSEFDKLKKEEIFPSDLNINTSNVSSSTSATTPILVSELTLEDLSDSKIEVYPALSEKIQLRAFELGLEWVDGTTTVAETDAPYLIFNGSINQGERRMEFRSTPSDFEKVNLKQIFVTDVMTTSGNTKVLKFNGENLTEIPDVDYNFSGMIKDLPEKIKLLALQNQKYVGNTPNENLSLETLKPRGNFYWAETIEGKEFWDKIFQGNFEPFKKIYGNYGELLVGIDVFTTSNSSGTQNAPVNEDWVKKFTADLDKLVFGQSDSELEKAITLDVIENAPQISKDQRDLNNLKKLLPSFQAKKYAIERAKILKEIKKLDNKLTYEGFIKPNEAMSSESNLFTPQGLLDYYYTQATQNPTAELEPACELPTPNGEKSKLPLSAYLNVRTPQFKKWFGDWEKAYETGNYVNCSKMIDPDTKEPKIYFHGVRKFVPNFGQFSNMGQGVVRPYGTFEPPTFPASYFAGEEDYAKFYGGIAENMPTPSPDYKPFIYKVFLSVKNPISLLPLDFMLSYKDFMDYVFVAYGVKVTPNQELLKILGNDIKKKNPMWIYVRRDIGFIEMLKDYGYDALFQIGDIPTFLPNGEVEPDRTKHLQEVEYLTFYPNQVKSATVKKSFYFDFFNDIRFKNGGYVRI
jgi:hypothetical protein